MNNVSTTIVDDSSTFCPAKWQEISFNPSANYLNACTKSLEHNPDTLEQQRKNLLTGIKDPSCDYCWKTEAKGETSLRQEKLQVWDGSFSIRNLEVNVSNLCNLHCSYCGPRYSTQWENDINKNGLYNILYDKNRLTVDNANHIIDEDAILEFINKVKSQGAITILGGEPLINPAVISLVDKMEVQDLIINVPTNLCYKNNGVVERLAELAETNEVWIKPTMDTVNENVKTYIRHGFNQDLFRKNLFWILDNTKINIEFLTLVTPHTIWDIQETNDFILDIVTMYPNRTKWNLEYCYAPLSQSFDILTDIEINAAEEKLKLLMNSELTIGHIEVVMGAIKASKYNYLARQDQQHFFKQYNKRNNIETPEELKFLIEDEIK
jgi:organic radical activating enzyme